MGLREVSILAFAMLSQSEESVRQTGTFSREISFLGR